MAYKVDITIVLQKSWRFASKVDIQDKGTIRRNLLDILVRDGSQK